MALLCEVTQDTRVLETRRFRGCFGRLTVSGSTSNTLFILPGAHAGLATPVPFPNTVVKQIGPMVLAHAERVGWRRVFTSEGLLTRCASAGPRCNSEDVGEWRNDLPPDSTPLIWLGVGIDLLPASRARGAELTQPPHRSRAVGAELFPPAWRRSQRRFRSGARCSPSVRWPQCTRVASFGRSFRLRPAAGSISVGSPWSAFHTTRRRQ